MNILYVITGLQIGGAEMVTVNIANEMYHRGHKVSILFLTGNNKVAHLIDENIAVIGGGMKKNPCSFLRTLSLALDYVKDFHPDIVHSQMFHANLFSRVLHLLKRSFVLITTEHNKYVGSRLRMFLYKITDRLSDANTNVSKEATDHFIRQGAFSSKKSFTVYNGIFLDKFKRNVLNGNKIRNQYGISSADFLFINVGRLTEAKDQLNLIKAFSLLCSKYAYAKLLIVGEGELRSVLEESIKVEDMGNNIFLVGAHSNIEDYYSAADCFVLSSAWEGLPMAIIEAKAASLPVISTIAGQEIVDADYVVPIKQPHELMCKMEALLLMNPEQIQKLGEKNRVDSTIFDIKAICDEWERRYDRINEKQLQSR